MIKPAPDPTFAYYRIRQVTIDGPPLPVGTEVSLKVLAVVCGAVFDDALGSEALVLRISDWAGPIAEAHNPVPAHDCDAELRAAPGYHPSQCKPETFKCSCGKQYGHVCDEAEGCWWEAMK